jgi:hypothetical protein
MQNSCPSLSALFCDTKVLKHPFYSIGPKMMFGSVLGHFANLWHVKDAILVFEPECTISGYQSCEACILLHSMKIMFGGVSEHFSNHRHIKRCETCVSGLNAPFQCNYVVKHPFYSSGPRMMFEHFANLRHVKRCNTCVRA